MRMSHLSILVVAGLMLGGCFQHGPQYVQYVPAQPAASAMASAPMPASQEQATYQTPPQPSAPANKGPTPRGFFAYNLSGPYANSRAAQAQAYAAPAAPAPVFAAPAPAYTPPAPVYAAPPVYTAPPVYAAPAPVYSAPPPVYTAPAPFYSSPCGPQGCGVASAAYGYAAAYPQAAFEAPYLLDAGDRLRVTVFGQEGLTNSYAVDAAGNVTLPLVGTIPARGQTTEQLSYALSERLKQGYIREPKVAIEVEAYRPFFIHGEVTTPGQYAYVANMTVENAIAIAGGFGPRADRSKVTVSRSLNGQTTRAAVGLSYSLRPGDTLRIGERWF
jgi:polysaccharide export outer membrane protein